MLRSLETTEKIGQGNLHWFKRKQGALREQLFTSAKTLEICMGASLTNSLNPH